MFQEGDERHERKICRYAPYGGVALCSIPPSENALSLSESAVQT